MIKPKTQAGPVNADRVVTPSEKLKQIVKMCEDAQDEIDGQRLIQKGALTAAQESHGFDPAAVRRLMAWRRMKAKDPAKRASMDELDDQYRFLCEGGVGEMPEQADDDIDRVIALSSEGLASIAAIKAALSVSQGKASKLRSLAAGRLAFKASIGERVEKIASSRSRKIDERELPPHDADGVVIEAPAGPAEEINPKAKPACIYPPPAAWQEITSVADEYTAREDMIREAQRDNRLFDQARRNDLDRRVEETDLDAIMPDCLRRTRETASA